MLLINKCQISDTEFIIPQNAQKNKTIRLFVIIIQKCLIVADFLSSLDTSPMRNVYFPLSRSRGVSGALNLQSATAGVMSGLGSPVGRPPSISDVDDRVSRNESLRTVSG